MEMAGNTALSQGVAAEELGHFGEHLGSFPRAEAAGASDLAAMTGEPRTAPTVLLLQPVDPDPGGGETPALDPAARMAAGQAPAVMKAMPAPKPMPETTVISSQKPCGLRLRCGAMTRSRGRSGGPGVRLKFAIVGALTVSQGRSLFPYHCDVAMA